MTHVRAVSPPDVTADLLGALSSRAGVVNLIVLVGVARHPDGDAVQFDVIAAEADDVLEDMRRLGVAERGSIVIDDIGTRLLDPSARRRAMDAPIEGP